jgi:hypothetical protein
MAQLYLCFVIVTKNWISLMTLLSVERSWFLLLSIKTHVSFYLFIKSNMRKNTSVISSDLIVKTVFSLLLILIFLLTKNIQTATHAFSLFFTSIMFILCFFTVVIGNVITENQIEPSKECIQLYRVCDVRDTCCQGACQTVGTSQLCWVPPWGWFFGLTHLNSLLFCYMTMELAFLK